MSGGNEVYKVSVGDVFLIPVEHDRGYVGQIIGRLSAEIYVVIFDGLLGPDVTETDIDSVLESQPIFGTLTYDARFRPGMWVLLGTRPADSRRLLPAYKTGDPELRNMMLENFDGTQRRPATIHEWQQLPYRSTRAPMGVEKAVLAHAGMAPWQENFDNFRISNRVTSEELFPTE